MPKYCSVPNCRNESGSSSERRSFYKFPLQDPVRLQRWLRNMGRENWTPSRHQYICNEHFSPSCFKVRWGIRYLEGDAVPTVFQQNQKRKAADQTEKKPKRLRLDPAQTGSADGSVVLDGVEVQNLFHTVHLYEVSVDQSQRGDFSLMDSGAGSPQTDLDPQGPAEGEDSGLNVPLTFCQTADDPTNVSELVLVSETQNELVKGITAAILSESGSLVLDPPEPESLQVQGGQEVIAYFETIPNVFPSETSTQFSSPDTVLSSALSSEPISSTLPIVSKHVPPSSLVLTLERLDAEEGGGATSELEEAEQEAQQLEEAEQEAQQLEEHRYHRDRLSKQQLEAIVAQLQKKVKVLQQRHRRHQEKLLGLENTVSQLRQSNLLNEERLQLLERAYQQTTSAGPDETVTIIYEQDAAFFYTPTNEETTLNVDAM